MGPGPDDARSAGQGEQADAARTMGVQPRTHAEYEPQARWAGEHALGFDPALPQARTALALSIKDVLQVSKPEVTTLHLKEYIVENR
jgi:hypothetical protein